MFQCCLALDHVHSMGVVHGDVKLSNLLVDANDDCHLCDFGEAFLEGRESPRGGTLAYAPPEAVLPCWETNDGAVPAGRGKVGTPRDMWSLGVTLFALVTGRFPFEAPTEEEVAEAIVGHRSEFPDHVLPESLGLARLLIHSLVTADPRDRLTAREVLAHPFVGAPAAFREIQEGVVIASIPMGQAPGRQLHIQLSDKEAEHPSVLRELNELYHQQQASSAVVLAEVNTGSGSSRVLMSAKDPGTPSFHFHPSQAANLEITLIPDRAILIRDSATGTEASYGLDDPVPEILQDHIKNMRKHLRKCQRLISNEG